MRRRMHAFQPVFLPIFPAQRLRPCIRIAGLCMMVTQFGLIVVNIALPRRGELIRAWLIAFISRLILRQHMRFEVIKREKARREKIR